MSALVAQALSHGAMLRHNQLPHSAPQGNTISTLDTNSDTNLNTNLDIKLDIVQIAYFVNDIQKAAENMVATYGAGPFFINREIQLASAEHRGNPTDFVHSSAYGQWGNLMVELVQQDNVSDATPFRDMYKPGEEGLHHMAIFVPGVQQSIVQFAAQGLDLSARAVTKDGGVEFAFIDATATLGHMIEIYEPSEMVLGFYHMVKDASVNWNGEDPIRG